MWVPYVPRKCGCRHQDYYPNPWKHFVKRIPFHYWKERPPQLIAVMPKFDFRLLTSNDYSTEITIDHIVVPIYEKVHAMEVQHWERHKCGAERLVKGWSSEIIKL